MDYLAAWRMRLAAVRLRATTQPIATIAADLGYASDSAFSASFRRLRQVSPPGTAAASARISRRGVTGLITRIQRASGRPARGMERFVSSLTMRIAPLAGPISHF